MLYFIIKMRGGVERVVIIVGEDGARIKEAVSRSGADEKIAVEFLQDRTVLHRQSHAKSLLRARYYTSERTPCFRPSLVARLYASTL